MRIKEMQLLIVEHSFLASLEMYKEQYREYVW